MDYKEKTRTAYDTYPNEFEESFRKYFEEYAKNDADEFCKSLAGKKILDAGAGPGNHAEYFKKMGFDVTCIDNSPKMVALCKKKGLNAQVMDLENITLPKESFDGVWAYTSLLHLKKKNIQKALEGLKNVLKPAGVIFIALLEGENEGFDNHPRYPNVKRWFAYYTNEEAQREIKKQFKIQKYLRNTTQGKTRHYAAIKYFCTKE